MCIRAIFELGSLLEFGTSEVNDVTRSFLLHATEDAGEFAAATAVLIDAGVQHIVLDFEGYT